MQQGKPHGVVGREDQPDAGDGQAGRNGVAERFVVPGKPGNAGGGKGPQFRKCREARKNWRFVFFGFTITENNKLCYAGICERSRHHECFPHAAARRPD